MRPFSLIGAAAFASAMLAVAGNAAFDETNYPDPQSCEPCLGHFDTDQSEICQLGF
jgi:hypothetical protein